MENKTKERKGKNTLLVLVLLGLGLFFFSQFAFIAANPEGPSTLNITENRTTSTNPRADDPA